MYLKITIPKQVFNTGLTHQVTTHGLHWNVQEQFTGSANEFCINPLAIFTCNLYSRHARQVQRALFLLKKFKKSNYFVCQKQHYHSG
mgnify:CR=1 FL=1